MRIPTEESRHAPLRRATSLQNGKEESEREKEERRRMVTDLGGMEEQVENVSLSTSGRIESWNSASKAGSPESNLSPNKFQPLDCGK